MAFYVLEFGRISAAGEQVERVRLSIRWRHIPSTPSKSRVDTTDDDTAYYVLRAVRRSSCIYNDHEEFRALHSHPVCTPCFIQLEKVLYSVTKDIPDPWMIEPTASQTLHWIIRILPRPSPR